MSETEFLHGKALSERIRLICAEDEVDCAVAFWGGAIRDSLFPRWGEQRVRIVCDIAMGCNSRQSLKVFGAPNNDRLKVLDGLHAKIFISGAGAIVGSANASANGIGVESGREGNTEAGVYFPRNSVEWSAVRAFFEDCWNEALPLDKHQLRRARLFARDPGKTIAVEGRKSASVLGLVSSYPEAFGDVMFFGENEEIESRELVRLEKRYDKERKAGHFEPVDRTFIINSPADELPGRFPFVLLYFFDEGPEMTCYTDVVYVIHGDHVALFGKENWRGFWKGRQVTPPVKKDAVLHDGERLLTFEDQQWAFSAAELAEALHG